MESAIKPMLFTSGITCPRASAAFVEVRIMLLRMLLFFLKSFSPALGTLSNTLWVLVTAWMVDIEAVRIVFVSLFSNRGLIMCANPVVVQEAAEMIWCFFWSYTVWF